MNIFAVLSLQSARYWVVVFATTVIIAGLLLAQFAGAQTDTIDATVTATNLAVTVSDGVIEFGSVALSTATTTAGNGYTQTATNDGSDAQLNVKSSNATGGTTWTLDPTPASDKFKLEVSTTSGSSYMTLQAVDTYLTASTTFTSLSSGDLDFRFTTPTASSDFVEKSLTITVQVAP